MWALAAKICRVEVVMMTRSPMKQFEKAASERIFGHAFFSQGLSELTRDWHFTQFFLWQAFV
jgi:hypothetical protein